MNSDEAISILKNAAWFGTEEELEQIEAAIKVIAVKPEWTEIDSGAIELELPIDVSQVKRIIVKQKDSHWCGVYYLGGHE